MMDSKLDTLMFEASVKKIAKYFAMNERGIRDQTSLFVRHGMPRHKALKLVRDRNYAELTRGY